MVFSFRWNDGKERCFAFVISAMMIDPDSMPMREEQSATLFFLVFP